MKKTKLILTLLVRDEEDIIEHNICYHLSHGVDFIITTDNDSSDSTKKILQKYESMGKLLLINEKEHNYNQSKWVSRMASIAIKDYGATHLIHCDADEFWVPKGGNLKKHLPEFGDLYYATRVHYVPSLQPAENNSDKINFSHFEYIITSLVGQEKLKFVKPKQIFFSATPYKIITTNEVQNIPTGNHDVIDDSHKLKKIETTEVRVFHFPIRSYSQFEQRVINGGTAALKVKDKRVLTHIRNWYEDYLNGNLYEVYKELALDGDIEKYLEENLIQKMRVPFGINYALEIYKIKSFLKLL